ncbi:MAG: DegT/DnrJ/EryC1/StrS family aminotransferase [Bacteroidales bacterium]|nr:DegT/DnrJ/EryC1/StrS family aminotransferase [Bacteroidales bacterium]
MFSLVPRLNYRYTAKDALISTKGVFTKRHAVDPLFKLFGNRNIYFVNHARTGLRIALNSLNLPPGSRIGVQAYNCHTVFNAIQSAGFKPVFIDVTDSFKIDIADLEIKKDLFDALIVTHLFGFPADMDNILRIIQNKPIIEDCAHSFLSKYKGSLTGTIGHIGVFSIGKAKFPSIGSGGYIIVNNTSYLNNIQFEINKLEKYSLIKELISVIYSLLLNMLHNPYIYKLITLPFLKNIDRQTDITGKFKNIERKILTTNKVLFLSNLSDYELIKKKQLDNGKDIIKRFGDKTSLKKLEANMDEEPNFFMIPMLFDHGKDELIQKCSELGYEVGSHFNQCINWAKSFGYQDGACKNCEKLSSQMISFPTYRKFYL